MYVSGRLLKSFIHPNKPALGAGVWRCSPRWLRYVRGAYTLRKYFRAIKKAVTKANASNKVGTKVDTIADSELSASRALPCSPPVDDMTGGVGVAGSRIRGVAGEAGREQQSALRAQTRLEGVAGLK